MATKNNTQQTKQFTMIPVFALWKQTAKSGKTYFSGKREDNRQKLTAFFNTNKKNPKEPDIRVYCVAPNGDMEKEEYISMWCNVAKSGKKYLTGKLGDKRVVGFINENAENNRPYVSVYYSEEQAPEQTKIVEEEIF